MKTIDDLLRTTVAMGGSDLHIKVGSPPLVRVRGELTPLEMDPLTAAQAKELSYADLTKTQRARFEDDLELDFAYALPGRRPVPGQFVPAARVRCRACSASSR